MARSDCECRGVVDCVARRIFEDIELLTDSDPHFCPIGRAARESS